MHAFSEVDPNQAIPGPVVWLSGDRAECTARRHPWQRMVHGVSDGGHDMYLRESRQKRADGSVLTHLQLAENLWDPERKRCAPQLFGK